MVNNVYEMVLCFKAYCCENLDDDPKMHYIYNAQQFCLEWKIEEKLWDIIKTNTALEDDDYFVFDDKKEMYFLKENEIKPFLKKNYPDFFSWLEEYK